MANNLPMAKQISFRRSQSFALGSGMNLPPAVAHVLNMQAARNLVLGRLVVEPGVPTPDAVNGDVTAITVQGASLMVSNQPASLRSFHPLLAENSQYIGCPIPTAGVAQVQVANMGAAAVCTATVYCDEWAENLGPVPSPTESGPSTLNFCAGLGSDLGVAAGARWTLQCTMLRSAVLGRLYLEAFDAAAVNYNGESACTIDQVLLNQTEQLSSQVNAGVTLSAFSLLAREADQMNLNIFAPMNSTLTISGINNSGVVQNFRGTIFCNAS